MWGTLQRCYMDTSLTFLSLLLHSCHFFSPQTPCTMSTFLGTPSSGLVFWAWHRLTLFQRNNNTLSFPFLLSLLPTPKPVSSASSKISMISFAAITASGNLLSGLTATPPPFYLGTLHHRDHHTSSLAVQLAFDHAFTCTYSQIFRTNASNSLWCPHHGTPPPSIPPSLLLEQAGFESLMAIQHANPCTTISPPPFQASLSHPQ